MSSLARKEYLSNYYQSFVLFMKSIANDKSNILNISINGYNIQTGKIKGADDILNKGLKDLFIKAFYEVEKEMLEDLQSNDIKI